MTVISKCCGTLFEGKINLGTQISELSNPTQTLTVSTLFAHKLHLHQGPRVDQAGTQYKDE